MNDQLIEDLREVLQKHQVGIEFCCSACSDTGGIYDPSICVYDTKTWLPALTVPGWAIEATDLTALQNK